MVARLAQHAARIPRQAHARLISSSSRVREQALPDSKLRLMISLHHQARSFITPENLDAAIVRAFVPDNSSGVELGPIRLSLADMRSRMQKAVSQTISLEDRAYKAAAVEDGLYSEREAKLHSALYGTESSGNSVGLPGLEVVREEIAALESEAASSKRQS